MKNIILIVLFLFVLITNVFAASVKFTDDYTIAASTSSDGVVWGGGSLKVYLDGEESDTDVICWDQETDGIWDKCFYESNAELIQCELNSQWLYDMTDNGNMYPVNNLETVKHSINIGSVGSGFSKRIDAKYYRDCRDNFNIVDTIGSKRYYVLKERQYLCDYDGGPYDDLGVDGAYGIVIDTISCPEGYGCDLSKEGDNADFGIYGTNIPSAPCSKTSGSCTTNADCTSPNPYCNYNTHLCISYHCGNGNCDSGLENGWTCSQDCSSPCTPSQCIDQWGRQQCWSSGSIYSSYLDWSNSYYCNNGIWVLCNSNYPCRQGGGSNNYCIYSSLRWRWRWCDYGCSGNSCNPAPEPFMVLNPDENTGLTFNLGV